MNEHPSDRDSMPKPAPSEWGKLNAGQAYGILCVDIGRAIFGIPWGKYELPIVYYVLEHSWGIARTKKRGETWPSPSPCAINFNQLATDWGMPRQRLYEARDRLKRVGFLLQDGDGFWVNKNAHEWVSPETGEPLLSPKMLAYAFKGRTRLDKSDKETSVTPDRDSVSRPSVTETDTSTDVCHVLPCQDVTVQRDTVSRSSVTPHDRNARVDSEILRLEEGESPTPPILKPIRNNPADVDRVSATAENLFPLKDFGIKVRQVQANLRMDWLEAALMRTHTAGKSTWDYVIGVYRGIEAEGGPKAKPRPAPRLEPPAPSLPVHVPIPNSHRRKDDAATIRRKMMGDEE